MALTILSRVKYVDVVLKLFTALNRLGGLIHQGVEPRGI